MSDSESDYYTRAFAKVDEWTEKEMLWLIGTSMFPAYAAGVSEGPVKWPGNRFVTDAVACGQRLLLLSLTGELVVEGGKSKIPCNAFTIENFWQEIMFKFDLGLYPEVEHLSCDVSRLTWRASFFIRRHGFKPDMRHVRVGLGKCEDHDVVRMSLIRDAAVEKLAIEGRRAGKTHYQFPNQLKS